MILNLRTIDNQEAEKYKLEAIEELKPKIKDFCEKYGVSKCKFHLDGSAEVYEVMEALFG